MEFNLASRINLNQSSPVPFTLTDGGVPTQEPDLGETIWVWLTRAQKQPSCSNKCYSSCPEKNCEPPFHLSCPCSLSYTCVAWVSVKDNKQ